MKAQGTVFKYADNIDTDVIIPARYLASTTRDPQFAEPAENATRPPELDENGQPLDLGDDPSANWVYEAETPVDKTAAELSREAEAGE